MILFGPLARVIAVVGLSTMGVTASGAAFAGPAEVAQLESYVGVWKGRGTLVAAEQETILCTLNIKKGNDGKVNLNGKCGIAGSQQAFTGTIAYVDSARRFEAAMRMATFSGTAPGQRRGDTIVFDLKERSTDAQGTEFTVDAGMSIAPATINVDFSVTINETGQKINATIPFAKS